MSAAEAVQNIIPAQGFRKPNRRRSVQSQRENDAAPKETIAYQELKRVHAPFAAVCKVRQACSDAKVQMRGIEFESEATMEVCKVPSEGCELKLPCLYHGYMSLATSRCISSTHELAPMFHGETTELEDACLGIVPQDRSAAPRNCAVWLAITGSAVHSGIAKQFINAFSHIGSTLVEDAGTERVASKVRMTAVAGVDADWVVARLRQEMASASETSIKELCQGAHVLLMTRWCYDAHNFTESQKMQYDDAELRRMLVHRTEFVVLNGKLRLQRGSPEQCPYLEAIATTLLQINSQYSLGMPHKIANCAKQVPRCAFVKNTVAASRDFFNEMTGAPVQRLSPYASSHAFFNKLLENTDVYVRIVPKNPATNDWFPIDSEFCSHAFLLCHPDRVADTMAWAKEHEDGLPCPDATYQLDWALHLCCPWTEGCALGTKVTLYAHAGILRQPISPPGSTVQKTTPCIIPLEQQLLSAVKLVPCSMESSWPGYEKLFRAFEHVMEPVFFMYKEMRQGQASRQMLRQQLQDYMRRIGGCSQDLPQTEELRFPERFPVPLFKTQGDDIEMRNEAYLLNAFGIDPESTRVSVGDAYNRLINRHAPSEITEMLLQASIRLGTHGSIREAFQEAAKAMRTLTNADQNNGQTKSSQTAFELEMERLRSLASAALQTRQNDSSALGKRTNFGLQQASSQKVRKVLQACNLTEIGMDIRVSRLGEDEGKLMGEGDACQTVEVMQRAMRTQKNMSVEQQAKMVLTDPSFLSSATDHPMRSLLQAAVHVLRQSDSGEAQSRPTTFFLSQYEDDKDQTGIQRIGSDGTIHSARLGEIVDASEPSVLLAHYMKDGSARLTVPQAPQK